MHKSRTECEIDRIGNHFCLLNDIRYWQTPGESLKTSARTKSRLSQIVPLDLYERAQELMEARTMHHNEVPFNSKGKALLSGMVYCARCGSKLVLTTSSGRRAKGEPKRENHIRYACRYKIRHPQDCDGQTGYSGEKLDGIIDKIVIQLFQRMKTAPRSQLIQKQREKELQLANRSVADLEKLHAAAERGAGELQERDHLDHQWDWQFMERVNIGTNFEIEVEFKISVTQFFGFLYPEGDKSVYDRAS